MKPLISVVMPVWNGFSAGRGYLRQAVWSIVNQDYEGPIELVVVDDGSNDGTPERVQEWREEVQAVRQSRRILLTVRPHEGVTWSLNHGIGRSSGEFVARQDADDWSEPERLSRQAAYLRDNPDAGMVGCAARVVHGDRVKDEVWWRWGGHDIPKRAFKNESPYCHGSVMLRRSVLEEVGRYDVQFPHAQDYDLFWRIAQRHRVCTIPEPLYNYRVHNGRVTSDRRKFRVQLACARRIRHRIHRELKEA